VTNFISVCPNEYVSFGDFTGSGCYRIYKYKRVEWFSAQRQCWNTGAKLAELETENEFDMLRTYIKKYFKNISCKYRCDVQVVQGSWEPGSK
jgi:hypothetical protein